MTGPVVFTTPCTFNTAPYFTDFDSGFPLCWTQETVNDDFDWTIDASGTTSSNTGPSDDITGGGNYLYIETSSPRLLRRCCSSLFTKYRFKHANSGTIKIFPSHVWCNNC